MPSFNFCGPTYTARSKDHNAEVCMNLFPEIDGSGHAKSKIALYGTPGMNLLATLPTSPVRGMFAGGVFMYAVSGNSFYDVSVSGTIGFRGTVNAATTPARVVSNGNQLLICSGDEVFLDNGAGITSVLTDGYIGITFLDGYFVALRNPTATNGLTRDQIYISALFDGSTWNALDFQSRQGSSDRLVAISAHNQQLWLHGQETTEVWYNSGNADYPFTRIQGSQIEMGAWPFTVAELDHSLFYVGTNSVGGSMVYRTQGFIPQRVSNHAVEYAISTVGPTSIPEAYAYQEGGHSFYVLCLPQSTWVYDASTGMWHQRGVWTGTAFDRHPGVCGVHLFANAVLIGSGTTGKIYIQSMDFYTLEGAAIRRYRQAPHISDENKRVFYHSLQVDMEMGTVPTGTPTALMRYSEDGGHTFTADKSVNLGTAGQYAKRAIWRRLGSSRDRVFGVTLPNLTNGPVCIVDAYLKATPEAAA